MAKQVGAVVRVRRTATRAPLGRERVLRAALEIADADGIESVTMRRLAQRLDVEAMSLYHYVSGKDELLDGIVDLVEAEIDIAPVEVDWKSGIRRTSLSAYTALRRHPWAAARISSSSRVGPGRLRFMESMLGSLRRAGFSPQLTDHAYHALDSHITGFTLWETSFTLAVDDLEALAEKFLRSLPSDEYPYLVEHVHQHLEPSSPNGVTDFEFGLDLILDGLERLRGSR